MPYTAVPKAVRRPFSHQEKAVRPAKPNQRSSGPLVPAKRSIEQKLRDMSGNDGPRGVSRSSSEALSNSLSNLPSNLPLNSPSKSPSESPSNSSGENLFRSVVDEDRPAVEPGLTRENAIQIERKRSEIWCFRQAL